MQDHLWSRQDNATFKFVTLMCVGGITGASRWLLVLLTVKNGEGGGIWMKLIEIGGNGWKLM